MSSSYFRGWLLLGFLCLWVMPTTQELGIDQIPEMVKEGEPFSLKLRGENATTFVTCLWYESEISDSKKFITGRIKSTGESIKGPRNVGATADENCTLTFSEFKSPSNLKVYRVETIAESTSSGGKTLQSANKMVNSSSPVMYSSFLLLATALFSFLRLL